MRMSHFLLTVVSITAMLAGVSGYAGQARKPSGAVTFSGAVAVPSSSGEGVTWGKGTLILNNGTQHGFEVIGLGVTSPREAIVTVQAVGDVFNLKKLSDFEGTYKSTQSEVRAGRAADAVSLGNEHGVVVALTLKAPATATDVTLRPSPTGITVKLDK
jgi:hypothetical protein